MTDNDIAAAPVASLLNVEVYQRPLGFGPFKALDGETGSGEGHLRRVSGGDLLTPSPSQRDGDSSSRRPSCLSSAERSPFSPDSPLLHLTLPVRQTTRHPQSPRVLRLPGNSRSSELHTLCSFCWFIQMWPAGRSRGQRQTHTYTHVVQLVSCVLRLPRVQRTKTAICCCLDSENTLRCILQKKGWLISDVYLTSFSTLAKLVTAKQAP